MISRRYDYSQSCYMVATIGLSYLVRYPHSHKRTVVVWNITCRPQGPEVKGKFLFIYIFSRSFPKSPWPSFYRLSRDRYIKSLCLIQSMVSELTAVKGLNFACGPLRGKWIKWSYMLTARKKGKGLASSEENTSFFLEKATHIRSKKILALAFKTRFLLFYLVKKKNGFTYFFSFGKLCESKEGGLTWI